MESNSSSSRSTPASRPSSSNSSCTNGGPFELVDMLIRLIEEVLSAITDKGLESAMLHRGVKLSEIVQPVTSDFSKIFERISVGAMTIAEQMSFSSTLSGKANKMASDVIQTLGDFHFASASLLAIATVLERVEKISANDRDCLDLIKAMFDLAKSVKQLTDMNLHSTKRELSEKMTEAVHMIYMGAIMCHSFLISKKIWKFLLTTKIRDELVRLWRKVDCIKLDLVLQMQIMFSYSLSSYNMSGQPSFSVHEGIPHLTQEFRPTEIAEAPEEVDHGMEQRRHTEGGAPVQNMVFPESGGVSGDLGVVPNSIKRRPYEQPESLLHMISKLLKKIAPKQHRNVARTILGTKLDAQLSLVGNARDLLRIACRFNVKELRMATEEFKDQLGTDTTDGLFNFFRGILWDMRPVVIKTIRSERENVGTSRLLNELESILCVQHRNVLKLVGFCGDGNRLMLVYDYMANGNLFDVLLHPAKKKLLDWPTRLKIILGVIAAIAYIHHGLDECIAHRDIKPSHILLDEDFNPRISEFGVATPLKELTGGKRTMPGTFDYMAPEYFRNGNLTEKVDMYSFGIVVLEIISGRRRMEDPANEDDFDLLDLAFRLQQEDQLVELADAVLLDGRGYDAGGIINTIMIALRCIEDDPNARPSAYVVLDMLSHLQEDEEQSNVRS